jgi:hypothetical protein
LAGLGLLKRDCICLKGIRWRQHPHHTD